MKLDFHDTVEGQTQLSSKHSPGQRLSSLRAQVFLSGKNNRRWGRWGGALCQTESHVSGMTLNQEVQEQTGNQSKILHLLWRVVSEKSSCCLCGQLLFFWISCLNPIRPAPACNTVLEMIFRLLKGKRQNPNSSSLSYKMKKTGSL